jgi:hypothetical protein
MQKFKRLFTFTKRKDGKSTEWVNEWLSFNWGAIFWVVKIEYAKAGYFDERPVISIAFLYFSLYIHLPIKTGINECDPPAYGFYITKDNPALVIENGTDRPIFYYFPWAWKWHRSGLLDNSGNWIISDRSNKVEYWQKEIDDRVAKYVLPYVYTCKDGTVQNTTSTSKREFMIWRMRGFMWLPIEKRRDFIDVGFSDEMGSERGSWKGGVTGTSFTLKKGESVEDCIIRMQKERNFCR